MSQRVYIRTKLKDLEAYTCNANLVGEQAHMVFEAEFQARGNSAGDAVDTELREVVITALATWSDHSGDWIEQDVNSFAAASKELFWELAASCEAVAWAEYDKRENNFELDWDWTNEEVFTD